MPSGDTIYGGGEKRDLQLLLLYNSAPWSHNIIIIIINNKIRLPILHIIVIIIRRPRAC